MNKQTGTVIVAFVGSLAAGSVAIHCGRRETPPPSSAEKTAEEEAHPHEKEGLVHLSQEAVKEAGIELATAGGGALEQVLTLPGEIALNADRVVHIVPRVGGIVQRVDKTLGDQVRAGEVLAILESRDLAEAKAGYLAAKQRIALAQVTLESAEGLRAKKILPGLEYQSIKRDFNNADIELRTAEQKLHALGLSTEEIAKISQKESASFSLYELRAPSAGTLIEKHLTLGEVVESNSDVFVIADLSTLWADVTVYAQDTPRITPGQSVHIQSEGFPLEATGKIAYISPLIDESTRTTRARVLIPNTDNVWKPGMFVSAQAVLKAEAVRVLVPNDAIQTVENQTVVFVPAGEGYKPQPVTVGRANATVSQILAGLEPGDRYVAKGAFVLKAELGKGEGGHEH
jgi:membrane fusion protein, heavy metal efflux system